MTRDELRRIAENGVWKQNTSLVQILGLAAARIAGEELEGVGPDRQRIPAHAEKAAGGRQVAADVEHEVGC